MNSPDVFLMKTPFFASEPGCNSLRAATVSAELTVPSVGSAAQAQHQTTTRCRAGLPARGSVSCTTFVVGCCAGLVLKQRASEAADQERMKPMLLGGSAETGSLYTDSLVDWCKPVYAWVRVHPAYDGQRYQRASCQEMSALWRYLMTLCLSVFSDGLLHFRQLLR